MLRSEPFSHLPEMGLSRTGSLHQRPTSTAASFRPRSVSAGNKAISPPQQPTSPYMQRISRSSPLLSASANGRKSDAFEKKLQPQVNLTGSRYKTELCRPFQESGACKYGDRCQFAHGVEEVRTVARHPKYKTELCRTFHSTGFCPYGPRCHFVHNPEEARDAAKVATSRLDGKKNDSHGSSSPPLSPLVDSGISSPSASDVFTVANTSQDAVFVFPSANGDDSLKTRSQPELGSPERESPTIFSSARTSPSKPSRLPEMIFAPSEMNTIPFRPSALHTCSLEDAVTSGLMQLHIRSPYPGLGLDPYNCL